MIAKLIPLLFLYCSSVQVDTHAFVHINQNNAISQRKKIVSISSLHKDTFRSQPHHSSKRYSHFLFQPLYSTTSSTESNTKIDENFDEEVDVIVIGSGFGGLSCAALTSKYQLETVCVEAHDTPGGCAHSFQRFNKISSNKNINKSKGEKPIPFQFDSGPSLISGLSSTSTNPLRQVLDAVGTAKDVDWVTYNGWMVHDYADNSSFKLTTGSSNEFLDAIEKKVGTDARREMQDFQSKLLQPGGLTEISAYLPPFALRGDLSVARSMFKYLLKFLQIGTRGALLTGPFTDIMDKYELRNDFNRKWFDYLAFALSGLDAAHTQAAPVAYTMGDLHKPNCVLDYPKGGMDALIEALVNGVTNHGGELRLNSRVDRLILSESDNGRAQCDGVILDNGKRIHARKGVVSNAPLWNMARMLEDSLDSSSNSGSSLNKAVSKVSQQAKDMEMTGSFMHLHLGIPKDGLDDSLECHHSVLNFDIDVTAEQNLVIISIPTVFDPTLAPEGYHIVHAYTAASENFADWDPYLEEGKDSGKVGARPSSKKATKYNQSKEYEKLKEEKSEALWKAVETIIPDVRSRAKKEDSIVLFGTPLTHRRYNQRFRGTYGPAPSQGKSVWELPGCTTPIDKLLACGDTTFPGIGLPGVAASGTIAANTLVDVDKQLKLMDDLKSSGALQ